MISVKRPTLTDYQTAIIYSPARFTITEACTKSGKTFSHLWWLFEMAHSPPKKGAEYWWVAPIYQQAEIAFNRLRQVVAPASMAYAVNLSKLTITTPAGGIIRFKTADKPDSLYGEDVWGAVMDEFTRCKAEAWHALRSTLTKTRAKAKLIGNYIGNMNWGHLLVKDHEGDHEYEYHKITAQHAVEAGVLEQAEVDQARKDLPYAVWLALYMCEGTADPGVLFNYEALHDMFDNGGIDGGMPCMSIDVGRKVDPTVALVWSGFRVEHVITMHDTPFDVQFATLKAEAYSYQIPFSRIVIDDDGIGVSIADQFRGCVRFNGGAVPIPKLGHDTAYRNLKAQCFFELAELVNTREVYVDCEEHRDKIIQELAAVRRHKPDSEAKLQIEPKEILKSKLGRSPDYADAMMMRVLLELSGEGKAAESIEQKARRIRTGTGYKRPHHEPLHRLT